MTMHELTAFDLLTPSEGLMMRKRALCFRLRHETTVNRVLKPVRRWFEFWRSYCPGCGCKLKVHRYSFYMGFGSSDDFKVRNCVECRYVYVTHTYTPYDQ